MMQAAGAPAAMLPRADPKKNRGRAIWAAVGCWIALAVIMAVATAVERHPFLLYWAALVGAGVALAAAALLLHFFNADEVHSVVAIAIAVLTCVATFAAAGGYRAAYGTNASLDVDLTIAPTIVPAGSTTSLSVWINVTNLGPETVRWFPFPFLTVYDVTGQEVLPSSFGCPVGAMGPFFGWDDGDLQELSAGATHSTAYALRFEPPQGRGCGSFDSNQTGTFRAIAEVAPPGGPTYFSLPHWSGIARSESAAITVGTL